MYRVVVYDIAGGGVPVVLFKAQIRSWTRRINAGGPMIMSLPISDEDANAVNLKKYRHVQLLRFNGTTHVPVWYGFLNADHENQSYIDVECLGMLDRFKKRFTTANQAFTGQGSTEAFGLLTGANSDSPTGVSIGTGGVTTAKSVTTQDAVDVLRAWELIAAADGGEYQIGVTPVFDFVPSLGTDKTSMTPLRFRRDDVPGSNCTLIGVGEDGGPMANRIIGTTTALGGLTSTQNDATSQTKYGLLVEYKQFNEAQDQTTLDAMTLAYLTQRANPLPFFQVQVQLKRQSFDIVSGNRKVSGFAYEDFALGDLITADIVTENQAIQEARRIAEIQMDVDENGKESMLLTLTRAGVYLTGDYWNESSLGEAKRRIREIENQL